MKELMEEKAAGWFTKGYNCCQSILLAARETYALEMNPDFLIEIGRFFREGMASGCTCGALVGAEMALGLVNKEQGLDLPPETAGALHDRFIKAFGSSCCRVLRKKQGVIGKMTKQGCKKITAGTAGLLYELIEEIRSSN